MVECEPPPPIRARILADVPSLGGVRHLMTDPLGLALERMFASWREARGELPRWLWDPDVDPAIYEGERNGSEWIQWRALRKPPGPSLTELAPDLGPFHATIEAHFAQWWFLALAGKVGDHMLTIRANVPGCDPEDYLGEVERYAGGKSRPLKRVPIGLDDRSSFQVVVDNESGEVSIEDWETEELEPIAASLDELNCQAPFGIFTTPI